jgi:DNA modification methylase
LKPYYDHAGITIYHGDCKEVLPPIDFDCLVMDPPYGINHSSNYGASWENTEITGDCDTELRDWVISSIIPQGLPMFVFGTWKVGRPARTRQVLIWDKGPASGMGDLRFPWKNSFEEIYVIGDGFCGDRSEAVLKGHSIITWESKGRFHPNAKPLSLLKYLIQRTQAEVICDPFMGSGPTLIAAKDLGRHAIGIEIEEKYCEIAAKRLSQEVLEFK